jgi:hypothetical protein
MILCIKNEPFFFEFNVNNDSKLQDLIEKSKGPVRIYFNIYEFDLEVSDYFEKENYIKLKNINRKMTFS